MLNWVSWWMTRWIVMVPSKTSWCTLSKSGVLMSLCAMDYHNVLCQNARAAITQRCIVIDQILGRGLNVTQAPDLKWSDNRLRKNDNVEWCKGQQKPEAKKLSSQSKELARRKQAMALLWMAKPDQGRIGPRKAEMRWRRGQGKSRARSQKERGAERETAKGWEVALGLNNTGKNETQSSEM